MRVALRLCLIASAVVAAASGCGGSESSTSGEVPDDFDSERCVVRIHGRSDTGAPPVQRDGYAVLSPDSNERMDGGGGVWIYDTEDSAVAARAAVVEAVDRAGCEDVVLHGFSNGAAFLASLVCDGEDLDGRLRGAVIDDPVTDDSSPDCAPAAGVDVVVYWTGAIEGDRPGASCTELGWTCAGTDELVGIEEFADRLGTTPTDSPNTEHVANWDTTASLEWLGVAPAE